MPQVPDRSQLRSEEQPEAPLTGPFGGIQSELPLTQIESLGFSDVENFAFRLGAAYTRPGLLALPALPAGEVPIGFYSFYNSAVGPFGAPGRGVFTQKQLYQFSGTAFLPVAGPGLSNNTFQRVSWDVLNYKLCFTDGSVPLRVWDGLSASYATPAGAPTCQFVAEIGTHLMTSLQPTFINRYQWSGIADPTDWTSFTSGLNDNVNNLGPPCGLIKLGQYGFGFHVNGILQIIPTGIGVAPFSFIPITNASIGTTAPYSIDHVDIEGRECAAYLAQDNVNVFDGTSVESIGDRPLDGRRRIGARSRILTDVANSSPAPITGYVIYTLGTQPYKTYWLNIPGVAVWVYNFDESNWTRFTYAKTVNTIGPFQPAMLPPAPSSAIGFNDGSSAQLTFGVACEQPTSITSGKLIFDDRRHKHVVKKFRLSFIDLGAVSFFLNLSNETGQNQTFVINVGSGGGDVKNYIQEFNLPGLRFTYLLTTPANIPAALVELAPIYEVAGEQRGGTVEN